MVSVLINAIPRTLRRKTIPVQDFNVRAATCLIDHEGIVRRFVVPRHIVLHEHDLGHGGCEVEQLRHFNLVDWAVRAEVDDQLFWELAVVCERLQDVDASHKCAALCGINGEAGRLQLLCCAEHDRIADREFAWSLQNLGGRDRIDNLCVLSAKID